MTSRPAPRSDRRPFDGASVLDDLAWRGLIAHSTDLDALRAELATGPITLYCGFDPTAPSLHVGHLAQTLTARRFQLAGHLPLALVGGATGMIGDPKPTSERTLNEAEVVAAWSDGIRRQLERFFDFEGPAAARMVNNHDWTAPMSVIEFLRDIGKHFSVNRMLDREAVARRLADQGISYTEFSYVLLQSMDYLELFRRYGCRLQTGGSDQFGNIVAGVDLVRRVEGASVHALTTPLMTKADGTKFGKTEGGAVWLDPDLTSPYAFYQFWLNTDDRDVPGNLRMFSFRSREEIEALDVEVAERPAARAGQRALAQELTEMVHGAEALAAVEAASRALFGSGELREVPGGDPGRRPARDRVRRGDRCPRGPRWVRSTSWSPPAWPPRRVRRDGRSPRVAPRSTTCGSPTTRRPSPTTDTLAGGWLVVRRGRRAVAGVRLVAG